MELGTFKRDFKILVSKFSGSAQTLLKTKSYLAGGALRSSYLQEKPKDYDLFFLDSTSMNRVIEAARDQHMIVCTSASAVTLKAAEGEIPFQLIRLDYGSPTEVVARFDFTMNMNFYMPSSDWGSLGHPNDIIERQLIFNPKAMTPLSALLRAQKFQARGWGLSPVQLARIGVAISKLNPITSGEQMKSLGMSEYSGPNVQGLDIGQVLSQELHPLPTKKTSTNDPFGYGNFTMSGEVSESAHNLMSGVAMAGVIQNIQRLNESETVLRRRSDSGRFVADANPFGGQVVDRHGEATMAIPERSPEVASQPVQPAEQAEPTRMLNADTHRWWDLSSGREVPVAAPMTVERLRNAVEQIRNMPMATPSEVDF